MSALTVTIDSTSTVTIVPAETTSIAAGTVVNISSLYDTPESNLVQAEVDGIGLIKLDALSDSNYSATWTSTQAAAAVKAYIQAS
mgnify:CR=1 FL=1|tara:strand:+ start:245 stop:499 length:255 start_codon:yes stop_codon:yes gene_type:complete